MTREASKVSRHAKAKSTSHGVDCRSSIYVFRACSHNPQLHGRLQPHDVALVKFCTAVEACVPFAHFLPHEDPVGATLFPGRATRRVSATNYPVESRCVLPEPKMLACWTAGCRTISKEQLKASV